MKLYQKDNSYLAVTEESPQGMRGAMFLAYGGPGPDQLTKTLVAPTQLTGWTEIELTNEWRTALDLPIEDPRPVEPRDPVPTIRKHKRHAAPPDQPRFVERCYRCDKRDHDLQLFKEFASWCVPYCLWGLVLICWAVYPPLGAVLTPLAIAFSIHGRWVKRGGV